MYILLYTGKDCVLLHDRPVSSRGRTPHDKKAIVLTTTKLWSWVPQGLNNKTGCDWPTVSCQVSLYDTASQPRRPELEY